MATVTSTDGTVIGYETCGAGTPLLLVHGSTGTRARWWPVRAKLAQRYTVHAMDRRGRGLSVAEAGPYSLQREAEDVAAVAEAVGGNVYVVGHSYGALAVLEAALITSAFRRILLYEPPLPTPGFEVVAPDRLAALSSMDNPRAILQAFYRETLRLPEPAIDDLTDREFPYVAGSIAHTAVRELAEVGTYRATERLADIDVPVRILLGSKSPAYFRAAAASLAAMIPGTTTASLRGQGHQAIDYSPRQFVRAVVEFDSRKNAGAVMTRRDCLSPERC
ncbi:alpha/beta hydrolase [Mycobacterium kubicae]|uniref:Alpha/beta hydrolase n=1 Tax=Mycobacterium kubicae TaxID=120959 RepID=A0AAX1JD54_9MYCO|nr:alpha/beta hydrolase [Mycobacterium kubicae]MCV7098353.1 alpha/beta hydrolase [Mycobacterium kubicae]ORW02204.1 alpha/beta hydrolase [Mycobacterium kubicae]QNI11197.1 alpha/beta hydrolase [Mycobacterium kubicae]QPI39411.1 alpha/beta hydrolase [Mycobacterium kubicae]GFG63999.1 alpha/beta hydrolase [Mycobacterium kubicae]